jgi:hypothetical protein
MPGLGPGIHEANAQRKSSFSWMAGPSPAMTLFKHQRERRSLAPLSPRGRGWPARERGSGEGVSLRAKRSNPGANSPMFAAFCSWIASSLTLLAMTALRADPHPSLLRNDTFPRKGGRGARHHSSFALMLRSRVAASRSMANAPSWAPGKGDNAERFFR